MRIVVHGQQAFGKAVLEALLKRGENVVAVYATPEKPGAKADPLKEAALAAKLPVPPFPAASGFAAGAVPVWRIRAEATTADGVTFARSAVVRPSGDPRRPLVALSWQDGLSPAPTSTGTTAAGDAMPAPEKKPTDGRS